MKIIDIRKRKHDFFGLILALLGIGILMQSLQLNDVGGILTGGFLAILGWNIKK